MQPELLSPWREFLGELDAVLNEPVQLHCVGGFVLTICYGMPRGTADVDFCEIVPATAGERLLELAGEGRPLAVKHGVHLHSAPVAQLPDGYLSRLVEVFPSTFRQLQLFALDPYDLALSKLERNGEQDRDDVRWLARNIPLKAEMLQARYQNELRLYLGRQSWHDQTLRLWLEEFFSK